jgi:hypothetical protein
VLVLVFIILGDYTDGLWSNPNYEHGSTIIQTLNYYYNINKSNTKLDELIYQVKTNNAYLVFYKDNYNLLNIALLKKRWNSRWKVLAKKRGISLENTLPNIWNLNESKTTWQWTHLKNGNIQIPIFYGVIYSNDVNKIIVNNEEATIIRKNDFNIWFSIQEYTNNYDIKIYNSSTQVIEKYPK